LGSTEPLPTLDDEALARHSGMHLEAVQRQSALRDSRVIDRHIDVCLRND
jgi:hypothetical protein